MQHDATTYLQYPDMNITSWKMIMVKVITVFQTILRGDLFVWGSLDVGKLFVSLNLTNQG